MTTYLGKICSFCLPRVPFVNCRQFMYLVISLLVLRAGYGIWLYQFLIIAYLFTILLNSQKLARSILLQQSEFVLVDGILFHSRVAKAKTKALSRYQLVLPETCIQTILHLGWWSTLAAHGGIQDTIDRIKDHFYFPCLATIVSQYIQSFHACQARKITNLCAKNAIVAYPTPEAPFSVWQIDLYGPLPCTPRANTCKLTAFAWFPCFCMQFLFATKML